MKAMLRWQPALQTFAAVAKRAIAEFTQCGQSNLVHMQLLLMPRCLHLRRSLHRGAAQVAKAAIGDRSLRGNLNYNFDVLNISR
ncbi:MAG: ketosteroid isomerase-like protein [Candidatus Azotimanducaceae bacterium]|jgi:ketosteroid isomerase-like protein